MKELDEQSKNIIDDCFGNYCTRCIMNNACIKVEHGRGFVHYFIRKYVNMQTEIPPDVLNDYRNEVILFYEECRKFSKVTEFGTCGIDLNDPAELLKVATAMLEVMNK